MDQDLTGDKAYEYNHVTVTGLEPNTTYYYTVEKNGEQTEPVEYTTKGTDTVKMIYVVTRRLVLPRVRHRTVQSWYLTTVLQIQLQEMMDFPGTVL